MMKLAFYINTNNFGADLTHPLSGNPGVGGTEFCFSLLIDRLAYLFSDRIDIVVFSNIRLLLPPHVSNIVTSSTKDLLKKVETGNFDFLILRTRHDEGFYELIEKYKGIQIIFWSHNYFNAHIAKRICSCNQIVMNVFVGKQMYDFYYDNDIIKKSTYIYNPVPDVSYCIRTDYGKNTLVYMGNIVKDKGIISLLKIWNIIEKKRPDAKLFIIGKGNLYDKNAELGELGIADNQLEKKMYPYIISPNTGGLKENISFLGLLADEKYDVFRRCAVGIVNPTATTETFGMGIIEMASVGLPVVTKGWNGHFDTVKDKSTGFLAFTHKQMANKILTLFDDDDLNREMGIAAKQRVSVYNPDNIAGQWFDMLTRIKQGNAFSQMSISHPYWNNYKFIRYVNSIIRFRLHLSFMPSIVAYETCANKILKKMKMKIN